MKLKHCVRRILLIAFPVACAVLLSLCFDVKLGSEEFYEIVKVVVGIWATLLGFLITAVSILVTFTGSRLTEEIKQTGHFKTVLFIYILTSIELLLFLSAFVLILLGQIFSSIIVLFFVIAIIVTMLNMLECLLFLSLIVYTIFK